MIGPCDLGKAEAWILPHSKFPQMATCVKDAGAAILNCGDAREN